MPKISTEQINDIRSSIDIIDVVSKYIPLTQRGKNYFGVCPFHDDHSPSMSVSKEKQIYTCFSCGATGNVYKFLMDYENITFVEAVKMAADMAGIKLDVNVKSNLNISNNKELYDIYETSLKFYQNNLNTVEGVSAKEYLHKRSISDELIKTFGIGLSVRQRDLLTKLLLRKKFLEKDLIKSGLIIKSDYGLNDIYCNRIMFPLCNLNGQVVGYSGRIYNTTDNSKYINTKETEIFKKGELLYNYHRAKDICRNLGSVIIMEGFMDVIRAYSIGVKNVVATMGTAVTKNQALLIKRMAKEVILLFDGDSAGAKATMACTNELIKVGVNPRVVRLEENLDPDEYILKYGKERFLNKLNNPINIMEFKLDYLKKDKNLKDTEDTAKYVNDILAELNNIDDDVLREVTINKLSKDSGISEEFLRNKIGTVKKPKDIIKIPEKKVVKSKYEKAEACIVNYMMKSNEVVDICINKLMNLPTKEYRSLAYMAIEYYKEFGYINEVDFMSYVLEHDEELLEVIKEINQMHIKDNYTVDEINDYLRVISDFNFDNEINRLKDLMNKTDDQTKKIEIGQKLIELKKIRGENYD